MKKKLYIIIAGFVILNIVAVSYAQDNHDTNKYSVDMYESQIEEPSKYDSRSTYKGVMSVNDIEKMKEDIDRLNQMQLYRDTVEGYQSFQEAVKLPELSKVLGIDVSLNFKTEPITENDILPEGVTIEQLAEVIVQNMIELQEAGRIPAFDTDTHEDNKETGKNTGKNKTPSKNDTVLKPDEIVKKEIEFKESSSTISYLIFGKKVIIEPPVMATVGLAEKEERLRREIKYLSIILEERSRQR